MSDSTFSCAKDTPPCNSPRVKRLYGFLRLTVGALPAVAGNYRERLTCSAPGCGDIRPLVRQAQDA